MRVLLIDDEKPLVKGLKSSLEFQGFTVDTAFSGSEALTKFNSNTYDFIILDLMLPQIDGISLCRMFREQSDVPIIMLTARDDHLDKIAGLDTGADDYMTKPFNTMELIARIRAIHRRVYGNKKASNTIVEGPFVLDTDLQRIKMGNREVPLTVKEFRLLEVLMKSPGRIFSRETLFELVWGEESLDTRTIDVHIRNIREKIEDDPSNPNYIMTKWGGGYYFRREDKNHVQKP
jgi:two-component system response regulator VicR